MERPARNLWLTARVALAIVPIIAVVTAIVATDLATGGADEPKSENQAGLGPGVAAATPRPKTPLPLPSTITPTAGPTTVPGPIAELRDKTRKDDLATVQAALEQYYAKKKEYPSTGGNAQTLCNYQDIDALCKIEDFLDSIPADPRGDQATNGYWYVSDGKTYTLIAEMEIAGNVTPQGCPKVPVSTKTNLYCVSGGH